MIYMNEWDIEEAAGRYYDHPILGPATRTLRNLADWTNRNSDGWPYWSKPCRAAAKLQTLIQGERLSRFDDERADATAAEYRMALRPIKSFRTRHGGTFEIEEVA